MDGELWVPNYKFVNELLQIKRIKNTLEKYYKIAYVEDPNANDLYRTTGLSSTEAILYNCSDVLINSTQSGKLYMNQDKCPFVCLTRCSRNDPEEDQALVAKSTQQIKIKLEGVKQEEGKF